MVDAENVPPGSSNTSRPSSRTSRKGLSGGGSSAAGANVAVERPVRLEPSQRNGAGSPLRGAAHGVKAASTSRAVTAMDNVDSPSGSDDSWTRVDRSRPSSVYLPVDEASPADHEASPADHGQIADRETTKKTWPFDSAQLNVPDASSLPPQPLTPSAINPLYGRFEGDDSSGEDDVNMPVDNVPPLKSSPGRPVLLEERFLFSKQPSEFVKPSSSKQPSEFVKPSSRSKHAPMHSMGTHALLSSRQRTNPLQRFDTPACWLVLYFAFNLGLTLYNKLVLQGFPFPWTLTAMQMLSGSIGTRVALSQGLFTQARLTSRENWIMLAFSVLYTINIAVSNVSLGLVSVPFHQVVRAMTPLFTIILAHVFLSKRHSPAVFLSLLPVVAGVAFATYGEYNFTAWGFNLTLLGTLLAAIKTIVTNRVQVGRLKLHPLDLLIRMSPLAFIQCVAWSYQTGEMDRVRAYGALHLTRTKTVALVANAAIAFGLNWVSFTANKKTSALTMTVAANVKQVLTIVLAVMLFDFTLNATNVVGILLTLAGSAWYGYESKRAR